MWHTLVYKQQWWFLSPISDYVSWPRWSRVFLIRKSCRVCFYKLDVIFTKSRGFFWHFFKYMYQSGNHVLPLPLLKIVVTLSKLGKLLYMYEFILSHTKISQMCMCKSVYYQVSLNCRPRFWKGNFKKKIFPFHLSWRLKKKNNEYSSVNV